MFRGKDILFMDWNILVKKLSDGSFSIMQGMLQVGICVMIVIIKLSIGLCGFALKLIKEIFITVKEIFSNTKKSDNQKSTSHDSNNTHPLAFKDDRIQNRVGNV